MFSPNAYNALGVGTTQLYNEQVVYNRKRHVKFKLGSRTFNFQIKPYFPKELSKEFLLVDLVNNITRLAEDQDAVLGSVSQVATSHPVNIFDFYKDPAKHNELGEILTLGAQRHQYGLGSNFLEKDI